MKTNPKLLKRLWAARRVALPVLHRHRFSLAGCLGLSLGLTLLELLRPQPIRFLFDVLLLPNPSHVPGFIAGIQDWSASRIVAAIAGSVVVLAAATAAVNYQLEVRLAYLGNKVIERVRRATFRHLITLPSIFHDEQKTGDLVLRLTGDIQMIRDLFVNFVVSFVGRVTLIVGMVVVMLLMNPLLTLVAVGTIPLLMWAAARATERVTEISRKQRKGESAVAQSVHELVGEIRLFAAYGRRDLEDERFDATARRVGKDDVKARRVRARLAGATELTLAAGICLVVGLGTYEILNDRMSAGELLVFLSYLRTMFKPIRALVNLSARTGKAVACTERVLEILEAPLDLTDAPDAVKAPRFGGAITFRDVSLTYGGKTQALSRINLEIAAGETVAIVGPSGSGKSSLCLLIPRIYDPDEGAVEIDGTDIRRYTLKSLRRRISLVLQDAGIFDLSIEDNVAFGQSGVDHEKIVKACRAAEIHDDIMAMRDGYETVVGERGAMLSGGQRRRLALARALLRSPRILILDEPFEGLDKTTADSIRRTILQLTLERTVIIVSHHKKHLEGISRVIRVDKGRIVEDSGVPLSDRIKEVGALG